MWKELGDLFIRPCNPPSGLSAKTNSDTTANLRWDQIPNSGITYQADIREAGSAVWDKVNFTYASEYLNGVDVPVNKGNCYEWRIRTICYSGNNFDTSAWVYKTLNTGAATCPSSPPPIPSPTPYVNPNFSFLIDPCSPKEVRFSNLTSASGISIRSIEWDLGDNTKSSSDTITLQASGGNSYYWTPCTNLTNCNIPNPKVYPRTTMNYIVRVTNIDGCTDSDTISVKYIDTPVKLDIPNAFTSNNDGINDLFRPLASTSGQLNAACKLFNRFGEMIFSSNKSTVGWDGKYKSVQQPAGIFTYQVRINPDGACPANTTKGIVMLIR